MKKICFISTLFCGLVFSVFSNAKNIELNLFMLDMSNDSDGVTVVAREFEKQNPDIKIHIESYPWEGFFQNIEVRMRSKNPNIDILMVDVPMVASYAARGFLQPLTDLIPDAKIKDTMVESAYQASKYKGKTYVLQLENSDQFLYVNKDLTDKAGIKLPTHYDKTTKVTPEFIKKWSSERLTWKQLLEIALKLNKDINGDGVQDVYGLHLGQAGRLYQLQPLGASLGGKIVSPDGLHVKGYLDNEIWLKAVTMYQDMFQKYHVEPKSILSTGADPSGADFINGKFAMIIDGTWNLNKFSQMNYVILPHPYVEGGVPATPTGSWALGIGKKTTKEKQQAAAKFLDYIALDDKGAKTYLKARHLLPVHKEILNYIMTDAEYDKFPDSNFRLSVYNSKTSAYPRPVTPFYPIISAGFDKIFSNVALGKDPKLGLEEGIKSIEKKLKRLR